MKRGRAIFPAALFLAATFLTALGLVSGSTPGQAADLGVVFMHGKQGHPGQPDLVAIARKIEGAGFALETPTLCWTQSRIYDRSLPDCLAELEGPIGRLRQRGITRIVVGGHSLGGFGALAFAARNAWLSGVFAIAPAPPPRGASQPAIKSSLEQARGLIAAGRGDEFRSFEDINTGSRGAVTLNVRATANIFMSFWDMDGPANLETNAAATKVPLLWVSGSEDRTQLSREEGFDRAPAGPLNRYARVKADHMATPDAAADIVVEWLRELAR